MQYELDDVYVSLKHLTFSSLGGFLLFNAAKLEVFI